MCEFDLAGAGAVVLLAVAFALAGSVATDVAAAHQVHVAFLGYVHQPMCHPCASVIEPAVNNRILFSVVLLALRDCVVGQMDSAD